MTIRRSHLTRDEVAIRRGFPVTSALRTVLDLACRLDPVEAVAVIDTALHKRLVSIESLRVWAAAHPRYRGVARLRRAVDLAEAATESPMETRLRLLLVLAGLPRPQVQVSLHDVFARADLYYPDNRLVIEYDGATHRESLAADNRRQNRLVDAGYRVLRFTASDVLADPASIVGIVRRALSPSFRRRSATLEP